MLGLMLELKDMPLTNKEFKCLKRSFVYHCDYNANGNIDTAEQAEINACGLDVRPSSLKAVECEAGTINKLE